MALRTRRRATACLRIAAVLATALGLARAAVARQAAGQDLWEAHTSMQFVREVAAGGDRIWAATSGGIFGYGMQGGEIERFTVVEGLHSVDTRTLAWDARRSVIWAGYFDGVLDRIDPESGAVTQYRDIERAGQFSSRGINRIRVIGDSLFVATEFGVVVFDAARGEVRDAYTRLGSFTAATPAFDILIADLDGVPTLWVGTAEGLARAPLDAPNLQDPASWSNETSGLPSGAEAVWSVGMHRDRIYVGTETDLFERTPTGFEPLLITTRGVGRIVTVGGQLFAAERFLLAYVDADGASGTLQVPGYENPVGLAADPDGGLWIGDNLGGLLSVTHAPGSGAVVVNLAIVPEGPADTQFTDMAFADDGTLWAASFTNTFSGFHRRRADGTWTAYTRLNRPELELRSGYVLIHAAADGSGWAGSEGDGLARVLPDESIETYDYTNSSLRPATGTAAYVIVGGLDSDAAGRLWVTSRGAGNPLHVRATDGSWTGLPPFVGEGLTSRATAYGRIMVDSYGQKWIIVHDENNFRVVKGLLVADTGADPASPDDDSFRAFLQKGAAGQGLPSLTVTSVAEDRDGLVWIGTESGIAYVLNTGVVARDASARPIWPPWADRSQGTFVLFGLRVNDLAVDPANRLWVASNEGAWLIEQVEAGYALVEHFTEENSPLFSNEVLSVAIDERTGEVFFATDRGTVSYAGDAIAPAAEADDLLVYPNPFRPGAGDGTVTFEGLVEETDIRVVTPGGIVVASFRARGGRVRWDGRGPDGRLVPTGMYLVVAVGEHGEDTAYGRLAVIR
jgi:ligand-binding sensor domain-containing protein